MDKQHVRTEEGDKRPRTEGATCTALRSEQQQFTTQEWPQQQQGF